MSGQMISSVIIVCNVLAGFAMEVIEKSDSDMHVVSPNYPDHYPPDSNVEWRFSRPYGKWSILYKEIDLEWSKSCEKDSLEIFDGDTSVNTATKRFCNKLENHTPFLSTSSTVRIRFKSDSNVQSKGFRLEVVHMPNEEDFRDMLAKKEREAAILDVEAKEVVPSTFHILVGAVSVCSLVFVVLFFYLIINLVRRRKQTRDRLMDITPQTLFVTGGDHGSGRRYTRQMTTESEPRSPVHYKPQHPFQTPMSRDVREPSGNGYNSYI